MHIYVRDYLRHMTNMTNHNNEKLCSVQGHCQEKLSSRRGEIQDVCKKKQL